MAFSFPEIKRFKGLFLQANSLDVPDGALEEASNVVIAKDGIISKIRGFYNYFTPSVGTLASLFGYKTSMYAASTNKLEKMGTTGSSPNITGTVSAVGGETFSAATVTPRAVEQNNNVYITTDNGILKLDSESGTLQKSGSPPALDIRGFFLAQNGPVDGDNQVGWRALFGKRDTNNNLILGAPGDITILTNSVVTGATWARSGGGPYTITVTTTGHNLSNSMVVTVSNSSFAGQNGDHTITVATASTFTFSMAADPGATGTLDWECTRAPRLEISIPSEITSTTQNYFVQIYRTSLSGSAAAEPSLDFKLIDEVLLTSAQISAGIVYYTDTVDDLLRGAELYTNYGSREGEAQSNYRPPLAQDIAIYKNYMLYANCTSRHSLFLDFVTTSTSFINAADYVEVKLDSTTRRYVAHGGVANDTVQMTGTGTGTITLTYTAHGFANNDVVYITNITGTLTEGQYTVSNVTPNTFDVTAALKTCTACDVQGLTDASGYPMFQLFYSGSSVAQSLRETAQGLVRAINRDTSSLVYARYISGPDDVPGKMRLDAKGFGNAFSVRANTVTVGTAFSPELPGSFSSGTQVTSTNDAQQNAFYVSKVGEPEAVPLVNFFPVGSRNKRILRMVALRDSVIFLKEDGVWRVTGTTLTDFIAIALDKTALCVASKSVDVINNQVVFLSNQGVCMVSENAVRIISRDIETPIRAILSSSVLEAQTTGAAYETERLYFLTTIKPGSTTADVCYVYNTLSDGWTTCDYRMLSGVVSTSNILYWIDRSNNIRRERKVFDRTDFAGQQYAVTVVSVASNKLSAVITTSATPASGDVIVKGTVFSRITSATLSGGNYAVTFKKPTTLVPSDSVFLYKGYTSIIRLAPQHGGKIGLMKQFSEMSMSLRDDSVSDLTISFLTNQFAGSPSVAWNNSLVQDNQGWGSPPWGFFGWGMEDGIASQYQTQSSPRIRIYIPIYSQRCAYIQPVIQHKNAGEEINLQSISFAVRGYQERVSK